MTTVPQVMTRETKSQKSEPLGRAPVSGSTEQMTRWTSQAM